MKVFREDGYPVKAWADGVDLADNAKQQLLNVAKLPFIHKHIAVMPDVHWGMGATVGSVIATKGAVVPAAVGVDIGCGMMAVKLSLKAAQLPDNLHEIRCAIEEAVPHGRSDNGGKDDTGSWNPKLTAMPISHQTKWHDMAWKYKQIIAKHPKAEAFNTWQHMGSLGGGNHFIEVCLDEEDSVWVMLHSGSRGLGNKIGQYFIEQAKLEMEKYFIGQYLPDKDLAYLVEHTVIFNDYLEAVEFAQEYAKANRQCMMDATLTALKRFLPPFTTEDVAVNCHHNYISRENHFGANVIVTRKGAVRAREGDLGIIPGSMGTGSFIVRGKGNKESFCSCSHGAGRVMSRGEAHKLISLEQHAEAMKGIEARLDKDVLDESPAAYKDISAVMAAQDDLVEIICRLRQIINIKG